MSTSLHSPILYCSVAASPRVAVTFRLSRFNSNASNPRYRSSDLRGSTTTHQLVLLSSIRARWSQSLYSIIHGLRAMEIIWANIQTVGNSGISR